MSVSVPRPCADAMDEDLFEYDEDFPDLPSDEEDDDVELPLNSTPRFSLGDMFEKLSYEKASPPHPGRPSFGWTHEDLGGDGICIGDCFANVSEGLQKLSAPCTSKVEADLGTIQWDGLQTMNPNNFLHRHRIHCQQVAKGRCWAQTQGRQAAALALRAGQVGEGSHARP